MARGITTKTHLENLAICPNSNHGDTAGDVAFAIYPVGTDPLNPGAANFSVTDTGVVVAGGTTLTGDQNYTSLTTTAAITAGTTLSVGGGYGSTGLSVAATGNLSTNGTLVVDGASTLTGAVAAASTLTSKRVVDATTLLSATTKTMNATTDLSGTVYISAAAGATTITLPAVAGGAGCCWEFVRVGAGNFAITGPANTLVTNDATTATITGTTVTYSTAGHIIGSSVRVYGDGSKWYIVNQGGTTQTVT